MNSWRRNHASVEPETSLPLFEERTSILGGLNDDSLVRETICDSIKRSGKSREQIADDMSALLGLRVTARMITSFTAESKELHRWPAAWDRAFCTATGDDRLLRCCAEAAGLKVIGQQEVALMELGRQYLLRKRADEAIGELERRLAGVTL
jgi:hypothetical protein